MTTTAPSAPTWTLVHVAPGSIKAHPDNPRVDVGDVSELVDSIGSVGILEPLVVAPPHDGITARQMGKATHVLIAGHRRLAAAKKARLATVPVLVRDDLTSRGAQIAAMLHENLQRTDLTAVEEGDAYQLVMDLEGLTQKALAACVGLPLTRVRERLRLAKLPDDVRTKVHNQQATIAEGIALGEFADDPKVQKQLTAALGGHDFAWKVRAARDAKAAAAARAKLDRELAAAGIEVHKSKPAGARDLSGLLEGYPWEGRTEWVLEHHGACPGRVAWEQFGSLTFGCADPSLHPKPKVEKSDAELAAEVAHRAEAERLQREAAVDTPGRLEAVRIVLDGDRTPAFLVARARALIHQALRLADRPAREVIDAFLSLAGTATPASIDDDAGLVELVDQAIDRCPLDQLLVLVDLANHAHSEAELRKARPYLHQDDYGWIQALADYGHTWSPTERARFTWRTYDSAAGRMVSYDVDGPVAEPEADEAASDEGEVA